MCAVRRAIARPEQLRQVVAGLKDEGALARDALPDEGPLDWLVKEGVPSVPAAAYKFAAGGPGSPCVLTGTANPGHLEDNVEAILGPPLPAGRPGAPGAPLRAHPAQPGQLASPGGGVKREGRGWSAPTTPAGRSGSRWWATPGGARRPARTRLGDDGHRCGGERRRGGRRLRPDGADAAERGGALHRAGARLEDVVRTRIFVTDVGRWEEVGRAHGELLGAVRPACTMVEVRRLIDPLMLVEVEADAYVVAPGGSGASAAGGVAMESIRP